MATLVNGNGNPAVYAQQDADLYVGVMGTTSCIMSVGSKFAATIETANLISVADGVILTKEGRRIQTDVGEVDEFNIPNGAAGVTRYYIIGYHLYTDGQGSQKCETFVQLMSSATDTIPEAEFRNGATEVYVSLYRVTQVGLTLNDPESLLPDALNIGDINASLTENGKSFKFGYDPQDDVYGYYKSEGGADTFVPFSSGCNAFGLFGYQSNIYSLARVDKDGIRGVLGTDAQLLSQVNSLTNELFTNTKSGDVFTSTAITTGKLIVIENGSDSLKVNGVNYPTGSSVQISVNNVITWTDYAVKFIFTASTQTDSHLGDTISIQLIGRQGQFRAYNTQNNTCLASNGTTVIDETNVQLDILVSGGYTSGFQVTTTLPFQYSVLNSAGIFDTWVDGTSGGTIPAYQDTSILLKF